ISRKRARASTGRDGASWWRTCPAGGSPPSWPSRWRPPNRSFRLYPVLLSSEPCEDEPGAAGDEREADEMVPRDRLVQIPDREGDEDGKGDHFLYGLQLDRAEMAVTDPVGRNLEAVFEQRNTPACQDDDQDRRGLELQMAVPGKG